jgi:hypothetical protein
MFVTVEVMEMVVEVGVVPEVGGALSLQLVQNLIGCQ